MHGRQQRHSKCFLPNPSPKKLETCCHDKRKVKFRQRMWEKYFKFCSSEEFRVIWASILRQSIGFDYCPIFCQFVTKFVMEDIIKQIFLMPTEKDTNHQIDSPLEYEDVNALRYSAGYVLRSLTKKLERSAHPFKKELVLCLN